MKNIFFLLVLMNSNAFADMANAKMANTARASLMAPLPMHDVPIERLSSKDESTQKLKIVAIALEVKTVQSHTTDAELIQIQPIKAAMTKKITEHPKWDRALGPSPLSVVNKNLDFLKVTFGDRSYEWAWFLRQTGKSAEAKKILQDLFAERSAHVMSMQGTYNGQSPLGPVTEVEAALLPMSTTEEKASMEKKMKELKVHVSNLKDFMIMT